MSLGREMLNWDDPTWAEIDTGVHEENVRAGVPAQVIPLRGPMPEAVTVPAELIDPKTMTIDEALDAAVRRALGRVLADPPAGRPGAGTQDGSDARAPRSCAADPGGGRRRAAGRRRARRGTAGRRGRRSRSGRGRPARGGRRLGGRPADEGGTFGAVARAYSLLQATSHTGPYGLLLDADEYAASSTFPRERSWIRPTGSPASSTPSTARALCRTAAGCWCRSAATASTSSSARIRRSPLSASTPAIGSASACSNASWCASRTRPRASVSSSAA